MTTPPRTGSRIARRNTARSSARYHEEVSNEFKGQRWTERRQLLEGPAPRGESGVHAGARDFGRTTREGVLCAPACEGGARDGRGADRPSGGEEGAPERRDDRSAPALGRA